MPNGPAGLSLIVATLVASFACIRLPAGEESGKPATVQRKAAAVVVWDGDEYGGGAKEWANCNLKGACVSTVKAVPASGTKGSNALEWHIEGQGLERFRLELVRLLPGGRRHRRHQVPEPHLLDPCQARRPEGRARSQGPQGGTRLLEQGQHRVRRRAGQLLHREPHRRTMARDHRPDRRPPQGQGQELRRHQDLGVPARRVLDGRPRNFTVFVDNIGFDNRPILSFISLPEKRNPAPHRQRGRRRHREGGSRRRGRARQPVHLRREPRRRRDLARDGRPRAAHGRQPVQRL